MSHLNNSYATFKMIWASTQNGRFKKKKTVVRTAIAVYAAIKATITKAAVTPRQISSPKNHIWTKTLTSNFKIASRFPIPKHKKANIWKLHRLLVHKLYNFKGFWGFLDKLENNFILE